MGKATGQTKLITNERVISLLTNRIQPGLQELLQTAQNDQEIAAAITFTSENAAKTFYQLANQVLLDTTLKVEFGEEDLTGKLRHYAAQKGEGLNIQVGGNQITGQLSKDLIRDLAECGAEMGVDSIGLQDPGVRCSKTWMLDL